MKYMAYEEQQAVIKKDYKKQEFTLTCVSLSLEFNLL